MKGVFASWHLNKEALFALDVHEKWFWQIVIIKTSPKVNINYHFKYYYKIIKC